MCSSDLHRRIAIVYVYPHRVWSGNVMLLLLLDNDQPTLLNSFCTDLSTPTTGATVTASTGDILLVANSSSGSSVTYDIVIIGTSA